MKGPRRTEHTVARSESGSMKIAIVASEAAPFAKTGGLADVVGALPKALFRLGHEPVLIMPLYRHVREANIPLTHLGPLRVPLGRRHVNASLWQGQIPATNSPAYFLQHDPYFDRDGLYGDNDCGYPDNCERFAFLSRGAVEALRALPLQPDVFHAHEWQAALVPAYLKLLYRHDPLVGRAGALLTIHNMAYQGVFPKWDMDIIGVGWQHFTVKEFEFWNKVNLLKAGIIHADVVNTVSPTYAAEIQTPAFGHGLEGVLRERHDIVHGVVNGIDDAVWNPAADPYIKRTYGPENLDGKAACKRALQRRLGLPQRKAPLAGIISRFAEQKGLDIAAAALPTLFSQTPLQCAILGDGDDNIGNDLQQLAAQYPDRLNTTFGYDDDLSHAILAGADMSLMPSRFEPCGLTQLYALKYGSVPIVRRTGGLADTVCNCTPDTLEAATATGFVFDDPTPIALAGAVRRAIALYRDHVAWTTLMRIGMAQDWSWQASAAKYLTLYKKATALRAAP